MGNRLVLPEVREFSSSGGARLFQIPLQEFPILWGFVYLVLVEDDEGLPYRVLVDTGSGFGECNQQLEWGLQVVSEMAGEKIDLESLTHVLITHGHIDHFGGLTYIRPRTPARVGVHELDLRNLTNYEERLAVVSHRLDVYLVEAGVDPEQRVRLVDLYKLTKSLHHSVRVDFTYEKVGMQVGPFEMLHVPGHCPGHVVIRLHDILLSGDHVLDGISPHQSPEQLSLSTGLEHYLNSLEKLEAWANGIRLTLGGHHGPIQDLPARIEEIRSLHRQRLAETLTLLEEPLTVACVSKALFGDVNGYNELLALEEAGAHVEYLYQRGLLGILDVEKFENSSDPAPLQYYRLVGEGDRNI